MTGGRKKVPARALPGAGALVAMSIVAAGVPSPARAQDAGDALRALQGGATQAPAQRSMAGAWSGKYVCGQGVTGAQVVFSDDGSRAVMSFFAVPENPGVPDGCFNLSGFFDPGSGSLNMNAGRWIVRPRNFLAANVSGALDATGNTFSGRIIGPSGCSNILLSRGPTQRPLPGACARAVP